MCKATNQKGEAISTATLKVKGLYCDYLSVVLK